MRSVRERERERERERAGGGGGGGEEEKERDRRKWRHHCHAKNGEEFCAVAYLKRWNWRRVLHFSLPKICTLVGAEFTLFVVKNAALFTNSSQSSKNSHSSPSFDLCQMAWQGIKAPKQTIEFPAAPSFSSKKWIKLRQDPPWGYFSHLWS